MRRTTILTIIWISLFFIVSGLSAKRIDTLHVKLHKKAVENIKNLPAHAKKDYKKLLKKYPDRLMSFLLGYEENGRLAATDPNIIVRHYNSVRKLMREKKISQPDEFFLSYVAKITVSDEAITDYRTRFENAPVLTADSLKAQFSLRDYRQLTNDQMELYRQVCLKTTELLVYKPTSGRDQSPLDIATKSLYGRCEESQILFAALCRTVGIPARAASTPWWAHQDDNHAWVEVFLNGAWHYSGDSDGGYWPDQTWFTGLTQKMVIITADGTLPAPDDEVLAEDEYGAVINSIKYYAGDNTRNLTIRVIDKERKPVSKCNLAIDVYNYYSLRPQTYLQTDENGEKNLTVGQGAFFIMAFKDGLNSLQFVPSNQEKELSYTITLKQTNIPEIQAVMQYPNYQPVFKDAPQSWKDDVKLSKDKWQKLGDYYSEMATPEFFRKIKALDSVEFKTYKNALLQEKKGYLINVTETIRTWMQTRNNEIPDDSLFFAVLKKCRLNLANYLVFDMLRKHIYNKEFYAYPDLYQQWLSTLLANDEKDLWQADGSVLLNVYERFVKLYPQVSYLPQEELLNLFDPTIFYENLPWQSRNGFLLGLIQQKMIVPKVLKPTPKQVIKHFRTKHKIKIKKALNGLLPLELALLQKNLTGYQYKILACSYLRANMIPANYSRIPNVVSVYTDSTWKYFDLSKNDYYEMGKSDGSAQRKVTFNLTDEMNQPIALTPEQIQICFLKNGQFYPLNEQPDYLGNGLFETNVPQTGEFYAQIGYRNSDSLTVYYLKPLSAEGKAVDDIDLQLEYFHRKWQKAEDFLKPVTNELEKLDYQYAVLGNYSSENSIRIANKLTALEKKFVMLGYEQASSAGFDYLVLPVYLEIVKNIPSLQNRTITLIRNETENKWQMYEGLWDKLP